MTAFSLATHMSPTDAEDAIRQVVKRFADETPDVTTWRVDLDEDRSIWVEVVVANSSITQADEAMERLCAMISDRFAASGNEPAALRELVTELVPA